MLKSIIGEIWSIIDSGLLPIKYPIINASTNTLHNHQASLQTDFKVHNTKDRNRRDDFIKAIAHDHAWVTWLFHSAYTAH